MFSVPKQENQGRVGSEEHSRKEEEEGISLGLPCRKAVEKQL